MASNPSGRGCASSAPAIANLEQLQEEIVYKVIVQFQSPLPRRGSTEHSWAWSTEEAGTRVYNVLKPYLMGSLDEKNIQANDVMIASTEIIENITNKKDALDAGIQLSYQIEIDQEIIKNIVIYIKRESSSQEDDDEDDDDRDRQIADVHDAYHRHGEIGARLFNSGYL
jgi:hypothetical protein